MPGLRITVHAGEWGGAARRSAARWRCCRRIAHGAAASDDPALVAELTARGIPLDLCPTSNVQAGIVPTLAEHALGRLHRAGAPVTLSTDDTTVSDITLTEEYRRARARQWADPAGALGDRPFCARRVRRRGALAPLREEFDAWAAESPSCRRPSLSDGRGRPNRFATLGAMTCPKCGTPNEAAASSAASAERASPSPAPLRHEQRARRDSAANAATRSTRDGAAPSGDGYRAIAAAISGDPRPAQPVASGPVAERRLVTVLFADLVGFTLSEGRDPEEEELLSRYFDLAREQIERYGGTVEKFIGDAVMAVWGAPTAHEDDAERAVRAALEVVDAVKALGRGSRHAGVLTGEAAVTVGARGQGMVAGDLVNTASRLQSAAQAGMVLVGETTAMTSGSIATSRPGSSC